MTERKFPSRWWFIQKFLAVAVTVVLFIFFYNLIRSATSDIAISLEGPLSSKYGFRESPFSAELKEISVVLSTVTMKENADVNLNLSFSEDPSSMIKKRVQWRFLANSKGIWRELNDCKSSFNSFKAAIENPGHYLVIATLPPVNSNLSGKSTEQINSFLVGSLGDKCDAFQIVYPGSPPPPPPPIPDPNDKTEDDDQKEGQGKEGQPGQIPPTTNKPRDISSDVDGGDESNGTSDITEASGQDKKPSNTDAVKIPYRKGAKPVTIEDIKKCRIEGRLPEIKYSYYDDQILKLTLEEWKSICNKYYMPFFLGPSDNFEQEFAGWPVLRIGHEMEPIALKNIREQYGIQFISIDSFSQEIQEYFKNQIDPVVWYKCDKYRGFLLSDLLVTGITKALSDDASPVGIGKIDTVSQIIFDIDIKRTDDGYPTVEIINTKLSMKQKQ